MVSEILTSTEFQMSLLLFFALAGYLVASRINQSAVIGAILVGLVVGPSVFGLITYTDFVRSLAHLGAVVLLFVVGLEFRLSDVLNIKYGIIAFFGAIFPWVSGYYLATLFGFDFSGAIFVGTAISATSVAITANVLREMGKLQTETAKAIIGAAVIDDILGLLLLSVSGELINGYFSYLGTALIVLKSFGFLIISSLIGFLFLTKLMKSVDHSKIAQKYPEFIFIFAMMVAFLYSMTAELIGLSAIVGSFIAGVSLSSVNLRHSKSFKEGAEYLHIIFASIFFLSLGILADLKALTLPIFFFSIILTAVAVLTKLFGCGISARLQGIGFKDSLIIGIGMVPRGEVAMIIGMIGLSNGFIGQNIYVSLIVMSLLTTLAAPFVLQKWFYKKQEKASFYF